MDLTGSDLPDDIDDLKLRIAKLRRMQFGRNHLEREERMHRPAEERCPGCGGTLKPLGEDISEQLESKLACSCCDCIVQAAAPSRPIDRGLPGPALLAHIATSKFAYHIPLYRQSVMYARDGVEIESGTMCHWLGSQTWLLDPLVDAVRRYALGGTKVHADDTPLPVLAPGNGKTKTGRLWVYVRDDWPSGSTEAPAVWFADTPDRRGEHPQRHLASFKGVLQADAFAGYAELYAGGQIREAACLAHARRKLHDLHAVRPSSITNEALERFGALYGIEEHIHGKPPGERLRVRQTQAVPLLEDMKRWFEATILTLSAKSDTTKAIQYSLNRWPALVYYCGDGQAEIDNLIAERALRGVAIGRRNYLFAGADTGGERAGNAYGSSPHGGMLVVAGDDHGCVSSLMPHQSDKTMISWHMPVVNPSNVADMLEFGIYGWALSRFSGAWIGFKAISETVESGSTVDLGAIRTDWKAPEDFTPPPGGLHNRWPDLPSLTIEARLAAKIDAVRHFARTNSIDKWIAPSPRADVGIVTCGKAHLDLMEALRRLELTVDDLDAAGVRIYKVGLSYPLETTRLETFVEGLSEVLVIEEKGPVAEQQIKEHPYNRADAAPLLSALGELRPSRVLPVFAEWLARHKPALDRRDKVVDLVALQILSNVADAVKRTPYFCSGCPHNTSTRVPEGSVAQAGIGCHFMASWMERDTTGLIQMGGEGVDWASHSMFTKTRHVFQNLGDGTYFHSGILAIRQAVAAKANITYKILYNDAVAMTGGQPVDGSISVPQIARQVEAEGIALLVVVSDEPENSGASAASISPRATRIIRA
ncbi:Indolepyruvate ferredoxin oxidoreductase, alpha and beta subunit [Candidatus Paraburkholderia kirkii]|nr:Indolepyruvate ferredoxin oxidoreductase, alpha and beta subunit [Candidatus Paraburkholderia kirkii]